MRKKKVSHTVIRNESLFCLHCGGEKKLVLPMPINDVSKVVDAFNTLHGDCKPEWKQPMPSPQMTQLEREQFWLNHGERGMSSDAMHQRLSITTKMFSGAKAHPYDPDDFRRCHGLLLMVPEFRQDLHLMKAVSPEWSRLVDNWDTLTAMLVEQMETGKPNGMYELMKKVLKG